MQDATIVRYFKKIRNASSYDVLVERGPCGHAKGRWQRTQKADKARKGLARVLGGETWDKLEKCPCCTGGGVWRVTWN